MFLQNKMTDTLMKTEASLVAGYSCNGDLRAGSARLNSFVMCNDTQTLDRKRSHSKNHTGKTAPFAPLIPLNNLSGALLFL